MATLQQGRIERLPVGEGERVRAGEQLIILDDRVQRVKTEFQKAASESRLNIEVTQARMVQAQLEYDRMRRLSGEDFASSKELNDAQADAEVTRLEHQIALLDHEQAIRLYERERLLLEQHHVVAPFTGYVAEHLKHVGETVEEREGVLTLVQLDPLEVTVDCPVSLAPLIREGDQLRVRPADRHFAPRQGRVVLVNRVADPASQTFKVKLAVDNADRAWISGLKVSVDFAGQPAEGPQSGTAPGREPGGLEIWDAGPAGSDPSKEAGD